MVKQFEDQSSEAWLLEDIHEFWNEAKVIDLASSLGIEGKVKQKTQSNLQQKLIVAWNKPCKFVDDAQFFHLCFVLTEDAQLLEEVKDDEKQVRVVAIKHGN